MKALMLWAAALALPPCAGAGAVAAEPGMHAQAMQRVIEHPTVHEVIGPIETPLSLEMSMFLIDHPDLSAWLVRQHNIAPYVIEMRGPGRSWADDGDGTTGFIDLVDAQAERRAYYTEGTHVSALFPDIHAAAAVLMEIQAYQRPDCGEHVISAFDVYVKIRSPFLSAMVKALRPFIKGVLIRKFTKAFAVAQQVGVLLAKDPDVVSQEILSHPSLSPDGRTAARELLGALQPQTGTCLNGAPRRPAPKDSQRTGS